MDYIQAILSNPVAGGIIGGSAIASVLWAVFRGAPSRVWGFLLRHFTVSITVNQTDAYWTLRCIQKGVTEQLSERRLLKMFLSEKGDYRPSPGQWHFKYKGRWIRAVPERVDKEGTLPEEKITLTALGRDTTILKDFVKSCLPEPKKDRVFVGVSENTGGLVYREQRMRGVDQIILPPDQKQRIIDEIQEFQKDADWYHRRGLPHIKGILLKGKPGTGKSSLALALGKSLGYSHITRFRLSSYTDTAFVQQWCQRISEGGNFCIIDDVDIAMGVRHRGLEEASPNPALPPDTSDSGVSLETMLAVLEGSLGYKEDTVVVLTTNHAKKLDPALIRPGRIDLEAELKEFSTNEVLEMSKLFLEDDEWAEAFSRTVSTPANPAKLQVDLMRERRAQKHKSSALALLVS